MSAKTTGEIVSLFDSYGRQARLFPALLTLLPPLLTALAWFPALIESHSAGSLLTLSVSCGLLYALSSWTRTKGRRLEQRLVRKWGGWPTTLLMRHSGDLNPHIRRRCHQYLSNKVPKLQFPSPEEEQDNPAAADAIYEAAIAWLRENTREKKFAMVARENAQYGFRRNLLSLKPLGVTGCTLALVCASLAVLAQYPDIGTAASEDRSRDIILYFLKVEPQRLASLFLDVGAIVAWLAIVTGKWVREAGFLYANALLATCDNAD